MKTKAAFSGVFLCALLGYTHNSYAQDTTSSTTSSSNTGSAISGTGSSGKGANIISLGIAGFIDDGEPNWSPQYILSFEHSISSHFGIGAALTYSTVSGSYIVTDDNPTTGAPFSYTASSKNMDCNLEIRGIYHLGKGKSKFDPYVGMGVAYCYSSYLYTNNDPFMSYNSISSKTGEFTPFGFIGLRYYIVPSVAVWTELDLGPQGYHMNIGASFKF